MIKELATDIRKDVFNKLNEIYNHRKEAKGLISCHNTLINSLKKTINKWYDEQIETEIRIRKL